MLLQRPTKRDQSGFSAIEALLVVLVVAALSVIGFVVYQRHKPCITKNSAATSQNQMTTKSAQTTTRYLDIKEWGVKLPLSNSIKDAYYVAGVGSVGSDGVTNQVYLGLTSLNGNGCTAAGSNHGQDSALGMIFRSKRGEVDPVTNKLLTQEYPSGVTIGSYFYGFEGFNDTNISTCKAPQTTIQSADSAFATAAKGIVAAQTTTSYLDIKEWGVRAPYSGSLKLSYTISSGNKSVTFSSDQLTALSSDCTGKGGAIIRWASTDQVSEGPPDANTPTAANAFAGKDPSTVPYAHIGDYYYTFAHAQSGCGDITTTAALQSQTNDAVKALVPNLQAIPN